jgi:hypothetical protein
LIRRRKRNRQAAKKSQDRQDEIREVGSGSLEVGSNLNRPDYQFSAVLAFSSRLGGKNLKLGT